jgi:ParB-like chromosome segregation protein Spo0J
MGISNPYLQRVILMDVKVNRIIPNRLNPNLMDSDKFKLLMNAVARGEYDPIIISPAKRFYTPKDLEKGVTTILPNGSVIGLTNRNYEGFYIICDGFHKWSAALALNFSTIKADVKELTENEAMPYYYQRHNLRGNHDPLKEAELFRHERRVNKRSRKEIIELYNLPGEGYLKTRLRLGNLVEGVVELYYSGLPDAKGELNFSHLREIATLPKRHQIKLATLCIQNGWTTRELEAETMRIKHGGLERLEPETTKTIPPIKDIIFTPFVEKPLKPKPEPVKTDILRKDVRTPKRTARQRAYVEEKILKLDRNTSRPLTTEIIRMAWHENLTLTPETAERLKGELMDHVIQYCQLGSIEDLKKTILRGLQLMLLEKELSIEDAID